MKRDIKKDEKGIAGFFFDLPVLVLIIAVVLVFIGSLYQFFLPIDRRSGDLEQDRICLQVKEDIQTFPKILKDGEKGEFSIVKLNEVENETIDSYLDLHNDYAYQLIFKDLESGKRWTFGRDVSDADLKVEMNSYRIPVSLSDSDGRSHLGKLEVKAWEV